jgi:hypothetical protein
LQRAFGSEVLPNVRQKSKDHRVQLPELHIQNQRMSLLEIAKKYDTGAQIIADWLGAGAIPVSQEAGQARADVCRGVATGNPCPYNTFESGFEHLFGESLKKIVEIKNEAKLRVDGEKSLHGCDICGCHLKTKIWTPMQHIRKHTSDDEFRKLPTFCWQRKEANI